MRTGADPALISAPPSNRVLPEPRLISAVASRRHPIPIFRMWRRRIPHRSPPKSLGGPVVAGMHTCSGQSLCVVMPAGGAPESARHRDTRSSSVQRLIPHRSQPQHEPSDPVSISDVHTGADPVLISALGTLGGTAGVRGPDEDTGVGQPTYPRRRAGGSKRGGVRPVAVADRAHGWHGAVTVGKR